MNFGDESAEQSAVRPGRVEEAAPGEGSGKENVGMQVMKPFS